MWFFAIYIIFISSKYDRHHSLKEKEIQKGKEKMKGKKKEEEDKNEKQKNHKQISNKRGKRTTTIPFC